MRQIILLIFLQFLLLPQSVAETIDPTLVLLKKLTNAAGAPGFEGPVRDILKKEWTPLLTNIHVDGMGNISGLLPGPSQKPKILLLAHMDEVGFIVGGITDDGFIYFDAAGGWVDLAVLTQRWLISTDKGNVIGYTGLEAPHLIQDFPKLPPIDQKKMFIDVGASSRKEVEENLHIRAGLPITPLTEFTNLNDAGTYLSKALDDRVGLTAITEITRRMKSSNHPNMLEVAASTQEELKSRGVEVLYGQLKPDVVINIEMSLADDFPALTPRNSNHIALGKGPALFVYDGSMLPNNKFVNFIIAIAKQYAIPLQLESDPHYGQDGSRLQRSNEGIPVINIGIPVRYGHTQSGVMKRKDLDQLVELVSHILTALDQKQLEQINDL